MTHQLNCPNCLKDFKPRHWNKNIYCSKECSFEKQFKDRLQGWLDGTVTLTDYSARTVKKYLTYLFGYKCVVCGISEWMGKPLSLQLDHIDGDCTHNLPKNLRLLCANCHSQTDTFGRRNKTSGRNARKLWREKIKLD